MPWISTMATEQFYVEELMMRSVCLLALVYQSLLLSPKAQRVERCSDAAPVLREVRYGQKRPIASSKCNSKGGMPYRSIHGISVGSFEAQERNLP